MRRMLMVPAAIVLGLVLGGGEARACDGGQVLATLNGVWKVNNAFGGGFGGFFYGKPQVAITAYEEGYISVDGSEPIGLSDLGVEANPYGGYWCTFVIGGEYAGRIGRASNGWTIFEIGNYNDRNKIELIRR